MRLEVGTTVVISMILGKKDQLIAALVLIFVVKPLISGKMDIPCSQDLTDKMMSLNFGTLEKLTKDSEKFLGMEPKFQIWRLKL